MSTETGQVQTPVVMVHGLWSNPSIWLPLTNEIFGDATLRARYQVWYYIYPSGDPYLWSAAGFRQWLDRARHELDPRGTDRASRDMILIGHSMGGLLAKTAVTNSGTSIWNAVFALPPGALHLPPEERSALTQALILERLPYVHTVIFMSTPQHGSRRAMSMMGQIGSALIHLPGRFSTMLKTIVARQPEAVTPAMRKVLHKGGADAIQALEPDNPVMEVFGELPIAPAVSSYSIIGNRGGSTGQDASDGVVSRRSAHLDGAASEVLVPCDHHSTQCGPAIAEVLRILRLAAPAPR